MTKYVWPLATSALVVVVGVVLLIYPFALHTNVGGWTKATSTDFWSGVGVIVIGLLGVMAWLGGIRGELVARGVVQAKPRREEVQEISSAPTPSPATREEDSLDQLLRPLAESVLRDLSEQLAAKEGRGGGGNLS